MDFNMTLEGSKTRRVCFRRKPAKIPFHPAGNSRGPAPHRHTDADTSSRGSGFRETNSFRGFRLPYSNPSGGRLELSAESVARILPINATQPVVPAIGKRRAVRSRYAVQRMVNPFCSAKVTSPEPAGPGNVTLAVTAPVDALDGIAKVAVTVLPARFTLLPAMDPNAAEDGLIAVGGGFCPNVIVTVTEAPRLPLVGEIDANGGP